MTEQLNWTELNFFEVHRLFSQHFPYYLSIAWLLKIIMLWWGNWSIYFKKHLHSCFKEGNVTPLQHSCLENPMDGGAWWAAVHGVAKSRTRLSDFTFTFHFHALEKEMATHFSILAWRIPGMGEPGGLPSMGSRRVGHDWSNLAAAAAAQLFSVEGRNKE